MQGANRILLFVVSRGVRKRTELIADPSPPPPPRPAVIGTRTWLSFINILCLVPGNMDMGRRLFVIDVSLLFSNSNNALEQ